MNYYEAARIRKRGLGDLFADKISSGQGIGQAVRGTVSAKFGAMVKGVKEKFDPLAMARFMFFGNKTATSLFGKAIGAKKEDIDYFIGKKEQKQRTSFYNNPFLQQPEPVAPRVVSSGGSRKNRVILTKILRFMRKSREQELTHLETKVSYDQLNTLREEDRHKEIIELFIEATKAKDKAEKAMAREMKKREKDLAKREAEVAKKETVEVPKAPKGEIPKPQVPKPDTTQASRYEAVKQGVATATKAAAPLIAAGAAVSLSEAIAQGESAKASYNAANMGTRNNKIVAVKGKVDLENMTIKEIMQRQAIKWGAPNEGDKLFAVGKYQMIPETLSEAVTKLKIDVNEKFTGKLQERLLNEYLLGMKRPAIAKYLASPVDDPKLLHAALKQLSLEWASIADPDIPGGKSSHYGSGNKASMSVEEATRLLKKDREKNLSKVNQSTPIPSQTTVADKVEKDSKENTDMKKSMVQMSGQPVIITQQNTNIVKQRNISLPARQDEINPMVK